ncbi:hypothetical protein F0U60_52685 [Archangium minus]|uniref:Uncharacterized protein n=1 Tax=Archangium minus TaxID=83450 RepID=A0ABY9X8V1_9BACT|nr:hypothetical protein F0U60_52685 [Archangium minus]
MKARLIHGTAGILFDALALMYGGLAAFLAFYAYYEGTQEQFWFYRLTLSTLPVTLVALFSTLLPHGSTSRSWIRFALFEAMSLWLLVIEAEYNWRIGFFDGVVNLLLTLLVDTAAYWMVLNVSQALRQQKRLT